MTYYITFKANSNPMISQNTGGWKHYAMQCDSKAQMERAKGLLSDMPNVRYMRVGASPNSPNMKNRIVINTSAWINSLNKK